MQSKKRVGGSGIPRLILSAPRFQTLDLRDKEVEQAFLQAIKEVTTDGK